MSYTSTEPEKPIRLFQVRPSDAFFDFSGFKGWAPRATASGSVLARRPLVNTSKVLVSRPCDVLLVLSWPGVGARKPVEYEPRSATSGVMAKRADSLPSRLL